MTKLLFALALTACGGPACEGLVADLCGDCQGDEAALCEDAMEEIVAAGNDAACDAERDVFTCSDVQE